MGALAATLFMMERLETTEGAEQRNCLLLCGVRARACPRAQLLPHKALRMAGSQSILTSASGTLAQAPYVHARLWGVAGDRPGSPTHIRLEVSKIRDQV